LEVGNRADTRIYSPDAPEILEKILPISDAPPYFFFRRATISLFDPFVAVECRRAKAFTFSSWKQIHKQVS
jgi:hypothetical protein